MDLSNIRSTQSGLSASDVLDIRYLHDVVGLNDAELSREFGVTRKAIYNIVNRKVWKQVPAPTTVRGFGNYRVYPDGRIQSKATGTFLTEIARASGPAVRVRAASGARTTVPVATLLKRAKFS